jgi:hypothetical protein
MTAKDEIPLLARNLGLSSAKIDSLLYASRMAAKVDSAAVQDGYSLYHHVIFFDEQGDWAVVQQGMNAKNMTARRYHWLSDGVQGFVCEPHAGIISESKEHNALDMTAANSQENQKICVDLACGDTNNLRSSVYRLAAKETLDKWCAGGDTMIDISSYEMPRQLNWHLFKRILISSQEIMKSFYRFSVWRAQLSERCHSSPSLYTVHELHGTTLSNTALPTEVNVMYRIPLQERSMTNRYATFTTLLEGRHTKRGEDRSAQETCKIFNQDISQRVRLK